MQESELRDHCRNAALQRGEGSETALAEEMPSSLLPGRDEIVLLAAERVLEVWEAEGVLERWRAEGRGPVTLFDPQIQAQADHLESVMRQAIDSARLSIEFDVPPPYTLQNQDPAPAFSPPELAAPPPYMPSDANQRQSLTARFAALLPGASPSHTPQDANQRQSWRARFVARLSTGVGASPRGTPPGPNQRRGPAAS